MTSAGKKAQADTMRAAVLSSGRKKNEDVEMTGLKRPAVGVVSVAVKTVHF